MSWPTMVTLVSVLSSPPHWVNTEHGPDGPFQTVERPAPLNTGATNREWKPWVRWGALPKGFISRSRSPAAAAAWGVAVAHCTVGSLAGAGARWGVTSLTAGFPGG